MAKKPENPCKTTKRKYQSKEDAVESAARSLRCAEIRMLRPYYCEECEAWHLTKMTRE